MIKPANPRTLAVDLLSRSTCAVKVAAVVADKQGIFGWGWNSMGRTGFGIHAEAHCIIRSNRKRLGRAAMYVAAERTRTGRAVTAKPCPDCQRYINIVGVRKVFWRNSKGEWED